MTAQERFLIRPLAVGMAVVVMVLGVIGFVPWNILRQRGGQGQPVVALLGT